MISFAASQPAATSRAYLALLAVGLPTTIASDFAGLVLLRQIPGGTLDMQCAQLLCDTLFPDSSCHCLFRNPGMQVTSIPPVCIYNRPSISELDYQSLL
ncbi:hypothetical protein BDR07DRAFT_1417767 [Suillus spraguei]|nr:hypothetical protein BDR07DRAFT_1417767 [Suillus spraguei]